MKIISKQLASLLMILFFTVLLISCNDSSSPRRTTWEESFGGSSVNTGYSAKETSDLGYIVIGSSISKDIEGVSNNGEMDNYVLKLSEAGDIVWHNMYGGSDNDMGSMALETFDNGYITVGYGLSTDIEEIENYQPTGIYLTNNGDTDVYINKLNSNGEVEWNKMYGGLFRDKAFSIIQTSEGGYLVAGITYLEDYTIFDSDADYYLLKLNADGGLEWEKTFGGDYLDEGYSVQQTSDGGYIFAGTSFVEAGVFNSDYYVLKLDSNGSVEWEKTFGGSNIDNCFAVQQTSDGGYIVAGGSISTDIIGVTNHGLMDCYILKLDHAGEIVWHKMYGGSNIDKIYSIQETEDSGFIVAGDSYSSDIDGVANAGNSDIYIMKIDMNGDLNWHRMYGTVGIEYGRSIQQTYDGGYIVAGTTSPEAVIPDDMLTIYSSIYVIKLFDD